MVCFARRWNREAVRGIVGAAMIPHSKPSLTASESEALQRQCASGFLARGPAVETLEGEFRQSTGASWAWGTGSGTAAVALALASVGVGSDDEVVVPSYVCGSVLEALATLGARPLLCDVGRHWVMTPETVLPVLSKRTRAVLAVHLYGIEARLGALPVPVVEDCCQAVGALPNGRVFGKHGAAAAFSFHATKLIAAGEGGMVTGAEPAPSPALPVIQALSPLSDLAASVAAVQFSRLPALLARRRQLASLYLESLPSAVTERVREVRDGSVFFRFPILLPARLSFETAAKRFEEKGISVRHGVDALLHRKLGVDASSFPVTEELFTRTLSLPLYPALSDAEAERVVSAAQEILS